MYIMYVHIYIYRQQLLVKLQSLFTCASHDLATCDASDLLPNAETVGLFSCAALGRILYESGLFGCCGLHGYNLL